jgi:hypothetical protein
MSDTFLPIHNQSFYLDSENQLEFLMIKILGDDSKSIFNKKTRILCSFHPHPKIRSRKMIAAMPQT